MQKTCVLIALTACSFILPRLTFGTTYYIDGSVASSNNGLSWGTAWKGFSNITGLEAGDTVYISGGSATQSYTVSDWTPAGGTSANPITYKTGQDAGHNGVVTITSSDSWLSGPFSNVVISGNVGGQQHWQVTPTNYLWEGNSGSINNVTLEYISVPNMGAGFHWPNVTNTNTVISHCNLVKTNDSSNMHDFIFYAGNGTGADAIQVHDSYIEFPYSSSDHSIGDDMWIYPKNTDFYNNTVQGHPVTYTWTQHSDVFQTNCSSNIHVYDNTFLDPGESFFYEDSQSACTVSSVLIYNNLILRSFAPNGGAQRIFDMLPENGGLNTTAYVDVVISNNTIVDQVAPAIFWCRVEDAASYTRTYVVNNTVYPSDTGTDIHSGVTFSNNSVASSGTKFVSYVQYGGTSNDLHLASNDTADIGQGMNMASYFNTDFSGTTRTVPWDISAYASSSGAPAAPTGLVASAE